MKVKYTIVIEVDEIQDEKNFDVDIIGTTLARHGAEGTEKDKKVTIKSCRALVTYERECSL